MFRHCFQLSYINYQKNRQKGAALFLAIMLLGFILTVGVIIVHTQLRELKFGSLENASTMAIFAADAGIERALYKIYKEGDGMIPNTCVSKGCFIPATGSPDDIDLDNGSSFHVIVPYGLDNPVVQGPSTEYIVFRSIGEFLRTQRSLEVNLYTKLPSP